MTCTCYCETCWRTRPACTCPTGPTGVASGTCPEHGAPNDLADAERARLDLARAKVRARYPSADAQTVERRARRAVRLMAYAGDPSRWTSPADPRSTP